MSVIYGRVTAVKAFACRTDLVVIDVTGNVDRAGVISFPNVRERIGSPESKGFVMKFATVLVALFAVALGSVPQAEAAGPIRTAIQQRRAERQAQGKFVLFPRLGTNAPATACGSAPAAPTAPAQPNSDSAPAVQVFGGTYYQTGGAFSSGCANGQCQKR